MAKQRPPVIRTVLLWSAVSIAALAVASVSFLYIAAPTDLVRDQIVQQVRDRTGRDLTVAGQTSLTLFPSMGITLQDVSLSPPPDMTGEPMARVAEVTVQVPVWPLLRGQLEVGHLVLRQAELNLRVDSEGRRNWRFRRAARARNNPESNPAQPASAGARAGKLDALRSLALSDARIENATINYIDERRNLKEQITGFDLEIGLASLESPLEARGRLTLREQTVDVISRLESLAKLLAGEPAQLAFRLSGQPLEATYEGTLSTADEAGLSGALTVQSRSLRDLATWFGSTPPDADQPLSLSGNLQTTPSSAQLSDAKGKIGATSVSGSAVLETRRGSRPRLTADLRLSSLDLGHWLTADGTAGENPANRPKSGKQVRGFVARHGWSDVPFNLARLDVLDAEVKLLVDRLTYRDITSASTRISATLADRIVNATIDEMQLYGGRGRGAVRLDGAASTPGLEANLQLDDVSALDLLQDASDFDWIAGRGRVSFTVSGQGRSELEIVKALNGKAEFAFRDGALVGFDIPGIVNGLHQSRIPRLERSKSDRTSFDRVSASFTINNGIAENRDLHLESSLIQVTGAGAADLPRRLLDYTARPKLLAAAAEQGSGQQPPGFELPIRITGSWDRPKFSADVDAVLKNPDEVIEAAKEVGKRIKSKDLKEALRGFLNDDGDGDNSGNKTKQKARDLLQQFLKP